MNSDPLHEDPLAYAEQRVRQLLADGVSLDQLTPEQVLGESSAANAEPRAGLSAANAAAFTQTLRSRATRTSRQLFLASGGRGAFLPEPSHQLPEPLGQAIAEICGQVADEHGCFVLLEERPVRGRMPEFVAPERCLRLIVGRAALYTGSEQFDGISRAYERGVSEDPVLLDGIPVAARMGEGLTAHVRLFAHPFLDGQELAVPGGAAEFLARIVSQFLPAAPAQSAADGRLATVRQALALLPQITRLIERSMPDRVAEIDTRLDDTDRQIRETQQRLVDLMAAQRDLNAEKTLVEREQASLSQETVLRALRESARIAALPTVRQVGVIERNHAPHLRVLLHPVVVEHSSRNYLCKHMAFTLPLANPSAESLAWEDAPGTDSPHPHISTAGSTCWGAAHGEVSQALRAGELARAVVLISGWARLYNHSSPYTSLDHFPITQLAASYHPEED
jgi:hypothetical protein